MSDLLNLAEQTLSLARGDEQAEVYVSRGTETEVRVYGGEVEHLVSASSSGVGIRVVLPSSDGFRTGFAWAGSLEAGVVAETFEAARQNAAFATPDPDGALPASDGHPRATMPPPSDSFARTPTERKIALAKALEVAVRSGDPRIRQVDSADYADGWGESAIASTAGIRAYDEDAGSFISVSAVAGEAEDTQTGSGYSVARSFDELDLEASAKDAIERSTRMLGARKIDSQTTTVVFDPRVTASLLAIISSALSGDAIVKGRSMFADRLGERVAVEGFSLVDDPTNPLAYGSSAVDGEGLACRPTTLMSDGVLSAFVFDTLSGRRASMPSTGSALRGYSSTPGPGCQAVSLLGGQLEPEAILATVGKGLYVHSISGVHSGVSTISGDFSVGAEGLVIRDGALAEPVREITVASTLQRMLLAITAIGNDLTYLPGMATGQTMAVAEIAISGN